MNHQTINLINLYLCTCSIQLLYLLQFQISTSLCIYQLSEGPICVKLQVIVQQVTNKYLHCIKIQAIFIECTCADIVFLLISLQYWPTKRLDLSISFYFKVCISTITHGIKLLIVFQMYKQTTLQVVDHLPLPLLLRCWPAPAWRPS